MVVKLLERKIKKDVYREHIFVDALQTNTKCHEV